MSQTKAQLLDGKSATIEYTAGSASAPAITFTGDTNTGLYSPGADQVAISANSSERIRIGANGEIGIGGANYGTSGQVLTSGGSGAAPSWQTLSVSANSITQGNTTAEVIDTGSDGRFVVTTEGTERLRVDSSGRLGLGTSLPQELFNVSTASVSDATLIRLDGGAGIRQRFFPSSGTGKFNWQIAAQSNVDNGFEITPSSTSGGSTFSTPAVVVKSNGNVGIGSTAPAQKLEIGGGSGYTVSARLQANPADPGYYTDLTHTAQEGLNVQVTDFGYTSTQLRLRRGFVGVNTSTPAAGLDVLGITGIGDPFRVRNSSSEFLRVDASGRLLVGTSSARTIVQNSGASKIQVEAVDGSAALQLITNLNSTAGPVLFLGKSRGASLGSNTVVQNGDTLGSIQFAGADGSDLDSGAAAIACEVDGTPGTNDMPGRLVFSTTADGASSPTERMRITNDGFTGFLSPAIGNTTLGINSAWGSGIGQYLILGNRSASNTLNNTGTNVFQVRTNGGIANFSANDVNLSDINTKKDIAPAAATWDCVKEWEIVNYRYKDQPDDADLSLGVIAQQVVKSCPEVVTIFEPAKEAKPTVFDSEGNEVEIAQEAQPEKLGVKEQQMYWMAIKALQEAMERIETLEAEVAALKAQ